MSYVIFAVQTYETAADRDRAVPLLVAHGRRSVANEPDTLVFQVARANDDDCKLMLYEVYPNRAAFETHWNGPFVKQAREEFSAAGLSFSSEAITGTAASG